MYDGFIKMELNNFDLISWSAVLIGTLISYLHYKYIDKRNK